jgi:hypothetical protein
MKLIMLPVLVSLAYLGFEHRGEIIEQYRAAYPADPVKRAVLEECARTRNFNRLDAIDRENCYSGNIGKAPVELAASPSPAYAYSPSHLAGNDVRRTEANRGYVAGLVSAAVAAPLNPAAVGPAHTTPVPPPAVARATPGAGTKHYPVHHTETAQAYRQRVAVSQFR